MFETVEDILFTLGHRLRLFLSLVLVHMDWCICGNQINSAVGGRSRLLRQYLAKHVFVTVSRMNELDNFRLNHVQVIEFTCVIFDRLLLVD